MNEPSPKQGKKIVENTIRVHPTTPLSRPGRFGVRARSIWAILHFAVKKFLRINGAQWAGAFAFNAFFSLFPMIILFVTIATVFIDRDRAGKEVIAYMESYIPISGEMQNYISDTIAGVVKARVQAGAVAFVVLIWVALKCFTTLIYATNHAWGAELNNWWRLPLKSLMLLGITMGAVLLGVAVPVLLRIVKGWLFTGYDVRFWVDALESFFIPLLMVFFGVSLFYRLAPRNPTPFAKVWAAALCTTVLLQVTESIFVIYFKKFATLNAVYGAFGGITVLLLWVYFSGCIFIFGACLCAAQAEGRSSSPGRT